jgi:hypothetical protein
MGHGSLSPHPDLPPIVFGTKFDHPLHLLAHPLSLRERARVRASRKDVLLVCRPHPDLLPEGEGTHGRPCIMSVEHYWTFPRKGGRDPNARRRGETQGNYP